MLYGRVWVLPRQSRCPRAGAKSDAVRKLLSSDAPQRSGLQSCRKCAGSHQIIRVKRPARTVGRCRSQSRMAGRRATTTDQTIQTANASSKAGMEIHKLRRAIRLPVLSQNAVSSGRQSFRTGPFRLCGCHRHGERSFCAILSRLARAGLHKCHFGPPVRGLAARRPSAARNASRSTEPRRDDHAVRFFQASATFSEPLENIRQFELSVLLVLHLGGNRMVDRREDVFLAKTPPAGSFNQKKQTTQETKAPAAMIIKNVEASTNMKMKR